MSEQYPIGSESDPILAALKDVLATFPANPDDLSTYVHALPPEQLVLMETDADFFLEQVTKVERLDETTVLIYTERPCDCGEQIRRRCWLELEESVRLPPVGDQARVYLGTEGSLRGFVAGGQIYLYRTLEQDDTMGVEVALQADQYFRDMTAEFILRVAKLPLYLREHLESHFAAHAPPAQQEMYLQMCEEAHGLSYIFPSEPMLRSFRRLSQAERPEGSHFIRNRHTEETGELLERIIDLTIGYVRHAATGSEKTS